jgi:hypothetical protein
VSRAAVLLIVAALAGALASVSLGSPQTAPAAAQAKPTKCLKWKKLHGKRVCVKRAKRKVVPHTTTTTTTTTTAPKAPTFPDGHYSAVTSQNTTFEFDLTDGLARDFRVSELDATCDPGAFFTGNKAYLNGTGQLDENGAFASTFLVVFTDGGTGTLNVNGKLTLAGAVAGTFTWTKNYVSGGTSYSCASGSVTWSGGTGASSTKAAGHAVGHYAGTSAQGSAIHFDVITSNGFGYITQLAFNEIDVSCTAGYIGYATDYNAGAYTFFLTASGHMHYASAGTTSSIAIDAAVDGSGHATGTLRVTFSQSGVDCDSGPVSWSATLG